MKVEKALSQCKFSRRYQGYYELKECIQIVLENKERLLYVTGIYQDVALKYHISTSCVERNIRTARNHAWENGGKEAFEKLSGGEFYDKPPVSEVIEILACYIKEQQQEER